MGNLLTQSSLTDNTIPSFHQEIPNKDEHKANPPDFYLNKRLFKNETTTSQIIAKFINSTQTILNSPHNNNNIQPTTSSLSKLFKQPNNTPDHPNNPYQQDQIIFIKETQSVPNDSFIANQKENNNNNDNSNHNNNYTSNSIHNSPNKNCIRYNRKHKKRLPLNLW